MNFRTTIFSVAALLALAFFVQSPAAAQTLVRADVPFAFEAAGQQFAPGTYTLNTGFHAGLLVLTNAEGRSAFMITRPGNYNGKGLAVAFQRHATGNALTAVWTELNTQGNEVVSARSVRGGKRIEIAAR
jgi:hypothetical protein